MQEMFLTNCWHEGFITDSWRVVRLDCDMNDSLLIHEESYVWNATWRIHYWFIKSRTSGMRHEGFITDSWSLTSGMRHEGFITDSWRDLRLECDMKDSLLIYKIFHLECDIRIHYWFMKSLASMRHEGFITDSWRVLRPECDMKDSLLIHEESYVWNAMCTEPRTRRQYSFIVLRYPWIRGDGALISQCLYRCCCMVLLHDFHAVRCLYRCCCMALLHDFHAVWCPYRCCCAALLHDLHAVRCPYRCCCMALLHELYAVRCPYRWCSQMALISMQCNAPIVSAAVLWFLWSAFLQVLCSVALYNELLKLLLQ